LSKIEQVLKGSIFVKYLQRFIPKVYATLLQKSSSYAIANDLVQGLSHLVRDCRKIVNELLRIFKVFFSVLHTENLIFKNFLE
jgi:hypothetical protein